MDLSILRIARKSMGLSLGSMSVKVGVNRNMLGMIERGKVVPRLDMLERICDILGLEVRLLIKRNINQ